MSCGPDASYLAAIEYNAEASRKGIADEDFDGRIFRGLFARKHDLDLVRVQDVGLSGASDEKLLEWTTDNNRIVVTHENRTMRSHVGERLNGGLSNRACSSSTILRPSASALKNC
jgi:hypothetical protein